MSSGFNPLFLVVDQNLAFGWDAKLFSKGIMYVKYYWSIIFNSIIIYLVFKQLYFIFVIYENK